MKIIVPEQFINHLISVPVVIRGVLAGSLHASPYATAKRTRSARVGGARLPVLPGAGRVRQQGQEVPRAVQ